MKCGQDYHGGNIQNGCGASFSWNAAPKYVANVGARKLNDFNVAVPKLEETHHEICDGNPLNCDECNNQIIGVRLRCVNCPMYNLCFECSLKSPHNNRMHIFDVLHENTYE
jgi:hypothetical protein